MTREQTEVQPRLEIINYLKILKAQNINGVNLNEIEPSEETIRNCHGHILYLNQNWAFAERYLSTETVRGVENRFFKNDGVSPTMVLEDIDMIESMKNNMIDIDMEAMDGVINTLFKFHRYLTEFLGLTE